MENRITSGIFQPFTYGRGYTAVLPQTAPAAGQPLNVKVPVSQLWRFLGIFFTLTTSAAVANREMFVSVSDQSGVSVVTIGTSAFVPASSTVQARFAYIFTSMFSDVGGGLYAPFPDNFFPGGVTLGLNAGAMQAGDQISGATVTDGARTSMTIWNVLTALVWPR